MTREFLYTFVPGAIIVYLLLVVRLVLELWTGPHERFTLSFFVTALGVLAGSALALTIYQDVAFSYWDVDPQPGESPAAFERRQEERTDEFFEEFVPQARRAFVLISVGCAVVTGLVAFAVGRNSGGVDWQVSLAFAAMTGACLLYTLVLVEAGNACNIGGSVLLDVKGYCS